MIDDITTPGEELGLLASGTSSRWDVAVNGFLDRDEWLIEIEGPQTYLVFQLRELSAVHEALGFLRAGPGRQSPENGQVNSIPETELALGRFGSAAVSLIWDNEDFPRCFLIAGPKERCTLRLSLYAEDIQMLIQAIEQVVEDLPHPEEHKRRPTSPVSESSWWDPLESTCRHASLSIL